MILPSTQEATSGPARYDTRIQEFKNSRIQGVRSQESEVQGLQNGTAASRSLVRDSSLPCDEESREGEAAPESRATRQPRLGRSLALPGASSNFSETWSWRWLS